MKKFFTLASLAIAAIMTAHAEPSVSWDVTISSGTPPPPVVRNEPVPPPRPSQIWVQGYWGWNGNAYAWMPGRWEAVRPGYVYVQPEWREGPRGWELHQGWRARDADRGRGGPGDCPPGHRRKGEC